MTAVLDRTTTARPDIADVAGDLAGKTVLVTGGSGFIGGRLVERLLIECGAKPRLILRHYGRAARLARFGLDRFEIVIGSLSDPAVLKKAVAGCAVVIHCAYDRSGPGDNMQGIDALIEACIANKVRLVHTSTFGIYEPLKPGTLTEDDAPVHSGIAYSETKIGVEERVMKAVAERGLDATMILPTIVYGPFGKGWTLFPAQQLSTGTLLLPANGDGLCNLVYVDDVCQALIRAAVVPAAKGRRYLISGAEPVRWGDYYGRIAEAIGRPPPQPMTDDELKKTTRNPVKALRLLLGDPKQVTRWPGVRQLAQYAKTRLTPGHKALIKSIYGTYKKVAPNPVFVPPPQQLALFSAKTRVAITRAQTEIGYKPAYDFERGMAVTGDFLRWAMPKDR